MVSSDRMLASYPLGSVGCKAGLVDWACFNAADRWLIRENFVELDLEKSVWCGVVWCGVVEHSVLLCGVVLPGSSITILS